MTHLIFTERKENLSVLASTYFDGFTIVDSLGYWKGEKEDSCIIIVVSDDTRSVKALCEFIKRANSQESVLLVSLEGEVNFV